MIQKILYDLASNFGDSCKEPLAHVEHREILLDTNK
jgi:hypothetical protein